ncbi:hypothetical protein [Brachybacterium paraconglomeratum]|uniref:hypothetical protein n=1 Tax=Brachybacterium paraconglomeratum TaxID=173362 RepID=UPI001110E03D|nr:hypothetical protein [Brachybacterium paraconglomeratum]
MSFATFDPPPTAPGAPALAKPWEPAAPGYPPGAGGGEAWLHCCAGEAGGADGSPHCGCAGEAAGWGCADGCPPHCACSPC